jgi:hypothetical protein
MAIEKGSKIESLVLPDVLPEERPEEYMGRIQDKFREILLLSLLDHRQFILIVEAIFKIRTEIDTQPRIKFSREKSDRVLEILDKTILETYYTLPEKKEGDDLSFFEYKRNRNLIMNIYSLTLFSYDIEECREYVNERFINGKNIWLLGGGDSVQDLLTDRSLTPASVVNIDPYIGYESVGKNPNGIYRSEGIDASNFVAIEKMRTERDIPLADEMWALYSVPVYLETPGQIEGLFKTITQNLAKEGVCRIFPLELQETNFEACKQELLNQVRLITDSPDFNAYVVFDTLIIERLPE